MNMVDMFDQSNEPSSDDDGLIEATPPAAPDQPVKRRPGRPRKDGTPPGSPREPVGLFEAGDGPKRRGRPPAKKNIEPIKRLLLSVHVKLALVTGVPELVIDEDEATMLAENGAALLDYYKIKVDGKRGALIAFMYAVLMIYGPRAFAYAVTMRQRNKEAEQSSKVDVAE